MSNDDWNTPQEELILVRHILGTIELDPCSNRTSLVQATRRVDKWEDGLATSVVWEDYRTGFMNPPFSKPLPWIARVAEWRRNRKGVGAFVGLLPGDTSTQWFQRVVETASAIHFRRGRFPFVGAESSPKWGVIFPIWDLTGLYLPRFFDTYISMGTIWDLTHGGLWTTKERGMS